MATKTNGATKFKDEAEAHAWVRFAAGAASSCAGGGDDAGEDAEEVADFADAMLVRMRRRQG